MPSAECELNFSDLSFLPDIDEHDWHGDPEAGLDENDVPIPRTSGFCPQASEDNGFFCPDCLARGHYSWVGLWELRCRACGWIHERDAGW